MEQTQNAMMQQLQGSHSYQNQMPNAHFSASHNAEVGGGMGKRHGFPPTPPFNSPQSFAPTPSINHGGFHSRSHSQPAFFSLDSLPSLTPSSLSDSNDASMDDHDHSSTSHSSTTIPKPSSGLPPRKSHRRSRSDIAFGFLQSSPPLPPAPAVKLEAGWGLSFDATNAEANGEKKAEGDPGDDLFTAFLNLEGLDDDKREELDSRGSSMKTNGADSSENEGESSANDSGGSSALFWANHVEKKAAFPPSGTVAAAPRHCRSLSMDSLIGKLSFGEESPKPPPSSMGRSGGQGSQANGIDGAFGKFTLEFGNGEFSAAEMKKIMSNEKLAEMASADPKRVKRILANRQSAARSKERKMRYIAELEHKVQTLQTESTTLSAQLTLMQRDSAGLANQNSELKFRLQAMEQQAQLRDALNEALNAEVQRLKLSARELSDSRSSNNLPQQMPINSQMFQLHQQQQQSVQIPFYRLQQQQNGAATNNDSNK
ncbi:bZIP transcription factor 29-like [Typha latifolia]|uniref:bZIP transcription factor 29-like n=1 Tax=Typha latifolia TaxID=4733 RepID=UPI003C2E7944